jgi:NAD(P)-dependent dehydrogenase (short-subunit alcohol dehydrogenase family)
MAKEHDEKSPNSQDPRDKNKKPPFKAREQDAPAHETRMQTKPDHGEASYKGFGRLKDKVALVTGGDSGIGRAVALAFAREGADVAISYLSEHDDAKETQRLVEEAGRRALLIAGDLAGAQHCKDLIDKVVEQFSRIDILVNNAAEQRKQVETIEEIDDEKLERTFNVNIVAMFRLVRGALPHMKAGGVIINTASIQAYDPSRGILDYAATKGAIVTFTKGLSQTLIERGIRVNAVAPGPVWTPLIVQSFDEKKIAKFGEQSPMKRPAQPAELAPAYVFLACDESRYVNGEILGVTGGMLLA